MAQAVCRSFLARVRPAQRRARRQALGQPGRATPQQVHADAVTHRQAANTVMQELCRDCVATVQRLCIGCTAQAVYSGTPQRETRQLVNRLVTVPAAAELRSRILKHVEAHIASTAAANRHAAAHRPRIAVRV